MRGLILAAAATAVFLASGAAMAQAPIVIKFSHVVANDTPKGKGALKFKELAEKYTNGKVKIEVYPNSSLYKDKEEIEALQLGSVQMLAPSTAKFAPLGVKEFEALDLPWLFKDEATYAAAMKGPIGKWLFQKLEAKGITGLAYWDNGFHMTSANRPLLMPADFQGLKISHLRLQDCRPVFPRTRLDPADHGVLGSLSGTADRRGRWLREYAVELSDTEIPRGAKGHHGLQSCPPAIRRDRQLQILERAAGRYPEATRQGHGRSDRLHQLDRGQGK